MYLVADYQTVLRMKSMLVGWLVGFNGTYSTNRPYRAKMKSMYLFIISQGTLLYLLVD